MLHNTWVEDEYRLEITRITNGSHVERFMEHKVKKFQFSLFVATEFIYRFILVKVMVSPLQAMKAHGGCGRKDHKEEIGWLVIR